MRTHTDSPFVAAGAGSGGGKNGKHGGRGHPTAGLAAAAASIGARGEDGGEGAERKGIRIPRKIHPNPPVPAAGAAEDIMSKVVEDGAFTSFATSAGIARGALSLIEALPGGDSFGESRGTLLRLVAGESGVRALYLPLLGGGSEVGDTHPSGTCQIPLART